MTMIARAMKLTKLEATLTREELNTQIAVYTDGNASSNYAKQGIAMCLKAGIASGKGNDKLKPKGLITRGEVAGMIERLLKQSKLI